jgi:phosphate transport system protein
MTESPPEPERAVPVPGRSEPPPVRHALRDQDALWTEFLSYAAVVVDSVEKSVLAVCEGRLDLIPGIEDDEADSDRLELIIERECLRVLALYEPLASDLRRMATILKVNRDWERIADLALRVARRVRKASRVSDGPPVPEPLKKLARDVLAQARRCYQALTSRSADEARAVIAGDNAIDAQYRALRKALKQGLATHPDHTDSWLRLLSTARNLERMADHVTGISQTIVYLQEGVIIRHESGKPRAE